MGLESLTHGSESRLAVYVEALTAALGHADRAAPFQSYTAGLLLPGGRKSVEPSAAEVVPEGDLELLTGLCQPEAGIAAIAAAVGTVPVDLSLGHLATDVVLGAVGMQRLLRPVEHHQQFGLVGMQPGKQPVQSGKAGAPAEDAIEAASQLPASARRRVGAA